MFPIYWIIEASLLEWIWIRVCPEDQLSCLIILRHGPDEHANRRVLVLLKFFDKSDELFIISQPELHIWLLQIIHVRHEKLLVIIASFLADKGHDRVVGDPMWSLTLLLEFLHVFEVFFFIL